jgi:hypothetical protein
MSQQVRKADTDAARRADTSIDRSLQGTVLPVILQGLVFALVDEISRNAGWQNSPGILGMTAYHSAIRRLKSKKITVSLTGIFYMPQAARPRNPRSFLSAHS